MIIYGINLDSKGRYRHYYTKQDIVVLKCGKRQDYFARYQCYNQLRNHPFESVSAEAISPVFCDNCCYFLTYAEHKKRVYLYCYHDFNPSCRLHETIYFKEQSVKNVRDLLYIAMMAIILVILSFIPTIPLGFTPVSIVLQNSGIMLAGTLLGWKKGRLSILLFFPLGMFIPAFSGSTSFAVFAGPTTDHMVAWFLAPILINVILKIFKTSFSINNLIAILLGSVLFADMMGAIYLSVYIHISLLTSLLSNLVFILGDTIKAIIASVVACKFKDRLMVP